MALTILQRDYIPSDIREEILHHFYPNKRFSILGCGSYATAYEEEDVEGVVYKITDDEDDYRIARRVQKFPKKFKYHTKVFRTEVIQTRYYTDGGLARVKNYYLIVTEYNQVLYRKEELEWFVGFWDKIITLNDTFSYKGFINTYYEIPNTDIYSRDQQAFINKVLNSFDGFIKFAKRLKLNRLDIHSENISISPEGEFKLIDFGGNYSKKRKNFNTKYKVQINLHYTSKFKTTEDNSKKDSF